jgi:hypothetical protein
MPMPRRKDLRMLFYARSTQLGEIVSQQPTYQSLSDTLSKRSGILESHEETGLGIGRVLVCIGPRNPPHKG